MYTLYGNSLFLCSININEFISKFKENRIMAKAVASNELWLMFDYILDFYMNLET